MPFQSGYCRRVPIRAQCRHLAVAACLAGLLIEIFASTLFLWPLDHSCARSANLSQYSSLLKDSHQQPIDLDAVQRNLIDATPESSLTLAMARSMGVDYDDIARCFEYPLESGQSKMQDVSVNIESLEPCRNGLHFETHDQGLSIVDRFELACSRQWLKVLVPQASVAGLLAGLVMLYLVWLRSTHRGDTHYRDVQHSNIFAWTSAKLTILLALAFIMMALNGTSNASKLHGQRQTQFYWFLLCVFLRSLVISSTLWRMLIVWQPARSSNRVVEEEHMYLVIFSALLILCKIFYMPIILRLLPDWSDLSALLECNLLFLIALTCLVELVHEPAQFHLLVARAWSRSARAATGPRDDATIAGQLMEIATQEENGSTTTPEGHSVESRPKASGPVRVCEFCAAKEEMLYRVMGHSHHHSERQLGIMLSDIGTPSQGGRQENDSVLAPHSACDDLLNLTEDPYRPTTIPIEYAAHTTKNQRIGSAAGRLAQEGGGGGGAINVTSDTCHGRRHNTSLLEMNLMRWPLISKLSLLTYCLAFNYFLIQTMPNHKLMHAETIASIMNRKTEHRNGEPGGARPPLEPPPQAGTVSIALEMTHVNSSSSSISTALASVPLTEVLTSHGRPGEPVTRLYLSHERVGDRGVAVGSEGAVNLARGPAYKTVTRNDSSLKSPGNNINNNTSTNGTAASLVIEVVPLDTSHVQRASSANLSADVYKYHTQAGSTRSPSPIKATSETNNNSNNNNNKSQSNLVAWAKSMARDAAVFNYRSIDYASRTEESLASSLNPLELLWLTTQLNGWPIELLVLLLYYSRWTRLGAVYFKLNRLFSLQRQGARLLLLEWLLVAVMPKQNHLMELEWLLTGVLMVARLITTLMLYGHLHATFKLSARMSPWHRLVEARRTAPLVLAALLVALAAPWAERTSLALIPLAIVASNLLIQYLAGNLDEKFRALLCPMMFDDDDDDGNEDEDARRERTAR